VDQAYLGSSPVSDFLLFSSFIPHKIGGGQATDDNLLSTLFTGSQTIHHHFLTRQEGGGWDEKKSSEHEVKPTNDAGQRGGREKELGQ